MKPKTEFRKTKDKKTVYLYVNGHKTNTWYRTPEYEFFMKGFFDDVKIRQKAETVKMMIDTGQIVVENDTQWEDWDVCRHFHFKVEKVEIVDKIEFCNEIEQGSGYNDLLDPVNQAKIIAKFEGREIMTQWTKRIISNTVSNRVGIKFYPYGYTIGFF